jgi:hypothetical protein
VIWLQNANGFAPLFAAQRPNFRFQGAVIRSDWHGQFSDKELLVGRLMSDGHEKGQ